MNRHEELACMIADPGEECILWPYALNKKGYGFIRHPSGTSSAHRAALVIHTGQDPEGMHAAHQIGCPRSCCNPLHLRWATPSDNESDKIEADTSPRGERNPRSRLTHTDVREIRQSTEVSSVLAIKYGVSARHIRHLKSGRFWEWLS